MGGGGCEIRTHGGLSTLDGFQDRCIKPLCQTSASSSAQIYMDFLRPSRDFAQKPQKKDYLLHFNHNLISFSGGGNNNILIVIELPYRKSSLHIAETECRLFLQFFFKMLLTIAFYAPS